MRPRAGGVFRSRERREEKGPRRRSRQLWWDVVFALLVGGSLGALLWPAARNAPPHVPHHHGEAWWVFQRPRLPRAPMRPAPVRGR